MADLFNPSPETSPTAQPKVQIEPSWAKLLAAEFTKPYFPGIKAKLIEEKQKGNLVYPPGPLIFNAFEKCPVDELKLVILGQDPYHRHGQAHGLCFSVPDGVRPPPSLVNIFKEIEQDLGLAIPEHGNLEAWAKQGVFLLNCILTVKANQPVSHQAFGWQDLTDEVIRKISSECEGIVFLLWGRYAQEKSLLIDMSRHHVLMAPHPSPYSAKNGFFGCKHFSQANELLRRQGKTEIDWSL